jgi:hypothetical protein
VTRVGIPIVSSVTYTFSRPVDTVVSEVGIPTLRGLGIERFQKVSLTVMDLNRLNSIILQFEQKIINKYTVNYLKLQ